MARQKTQGQTLNLFILEQFPVVPPDAYERTFGGKSAAEIVREAVLELTYTAHDMASFASDLGYVDGSLRSFALVTLLNLPDEMLPDVLLLDEPELGLHPAAVALIAEMIKSLATERQVIVATQSPLLVDAFDLDEIIVTELRDQRTEFHRLDPNDYKQWLEEAFTTGELWQKNLLGGRP